MPKLFKAPIYTEVQIEEMKEKDMIFPFTSKYMRYDNVKRQYIPTEALLLKQGINLNEFLQTTDEDTPTNINNELEYISDQVYSYIFKNSGSNMNTLKWMIAKSVRYGMTPFRFRLAFEEILWKQARFYVSNDDISKSSGVDVEQKQWLNKGVLVNESRNIEPQVKIMLMDLGLTWVGSYDKQFSGLVTQENW